MELSRRDALAALVASGVAVGGGTLLFDEYEDDADGRAIGDADLDSLVALAEVLYPSEASGIPAFVETYVLGRVEEREAYREGMAEALTELDERAREWYGAAFVDLSRGNRNALLSELGVETAEPEPEGATPERIRYYLVNDLLFAFYASPAGGELVGIENPQGYPGGIESYQRGPDA